MKHRNGYRDTDMGMWLKFLKIQDICTEKSVCTYI